MKEPEYPGGLERKRCEERIKAEVRDFPPTLPLSLREEVRIRGMHSRCSICRACPMLNQLAAWLPPSLEPRGAVILKLAS